MLIPTTIDLYNLRLDELSHLGGNLTVMVNNSTIPSILQQPVVETLCTTAERFKASLYKSATSGMGDELAEADVYRDRVFTSVKGALQSKFVFGGEPAAAAEYLYAFFEKHGQVTNMSYARESEAIDKILSDLNTTKSKALIEIVGLINEIDALKEAQKSFAQMFLTKQGANSELGKLPSGSSLKREMIAAIRAFLYLVSIMRGQPGWDDLYSNVMEALKSAKYALK